MVEVECIDVRYDEGVREKKEKDIIPTLPASHLGTSSISGQPFIKITDKPIVLGLCKENGFRQTYSVYDENGPAPTLTCMEGGNRQPKIAEPKAGTLNGYRVRRITSREAWRFMGYTDADYDKAASVNSESQLYKEAGNAIVKHVLMAIFKQMID